MNISWRSLLACLALLAGSLPAQAACEGKFPNPVADVCWSCMFPLRLGGQVLVGNDQLDAGVEKGWLCNCSTPGKTKLGLRIEFWEPVRVVEITRTAFCLVAMDGLQLDPGLQVREPGARTGIATADGTTSFAFYHAHWYVNPILHWLGVLLDFDCLERSGFDLAYLSELDPTWDDDQLAAILSPEGLLTANLAGVAACAVDCAKTVTGWPVEELWWCAGCTGLLLPTSGNVAAHVSGRQSSALLAARLALRMHRTGAAYYTHSRRAACGVGWTQPYLIKHAYKMTMLHPRPQAKRNGRCCEPFGTSPELWARGSEWPISGEDFVYLLFRKRHCCAGAIGF